MKPHYWLLIILVLGLALRLSMVLQGYQGFYESDGYYYYAVMKETIANNGIIPALLPLSGVPPLNIPYGEFPGLIYAGLIPFYILKFLLLLLPIQPIVLWSWFLSSNLLLWIVYSLPVLFGLLGILVAYLLTARFFKSDKIALIAAFFYATLPLAVYRNMALAYRGESFVPIIFAWFILAQTSPNKNIRFLSWFLIPICIVFWKAGAYVAAIIIVTYILIWARKRSLSFYAGWALGLLIGCFIGTWLFLPTLLSSTTEIISTTLEGVPLGWQSFLLFFNIAGIFAPIGLAFLHTHYEADAIERKLLIYLTAMLIITVPLALYQVRWIFLMAFPIAIFAAYGLYKLLNFIYVIQGSTNAKLYNVVLVALLLLSLALSQLVIVNTRPVDNMPPLLQALSWVQSNTAPNSSFLTFWADGSQVEGWANRASYSDSVNQNTTRVQQFSDWLFQRAGNYTYLNQTNVTYLLVRRLWLQGIPMIAEQGNLSTSTSIIGTNFQAFENKSVPYNIIYENNDTIIYQIKP